MALTVTVNKYASSNVHAVHRKHTNNKRHSSPSNNNFGRRNLLLLSTAVVTSAPQVIDSQTELLKKYLKKSEENKAKNDKERTDSYYKRNYKDYFMSIEGSIRAKNADQLSETDKAILDWLQKNS
ncbi:hypothetical protein ACFE04_002376 [Oxalis oulophora]